jgi:hypothetical protein
MTSSIGFGIILWVIVLYPFWSPRCRRIRREQRVSRNSPKTKTGPAWEQDAPFPECFDEQEDDL